MTILVHEGKEENLDQTRFCISLRFTHMLIPLRLVYFSVSANKHASMHVTHVNNLHWSVFHMKYLQSNILHVRGNGILSKIRTTSLSAIFSSGPKGESPIFWCDTLYLNYMMFPLVFICPLLIWGMVLLNMRSPKGSCCSMSDDLSWSVKRIEIVAEVDDTMTALCQLFINLVYRDTRLRCILKTARRRSRQWGNICIKISLKNKTNYPVSSSSHPSATAKTARHCLRWGEGVTESTGTSYTVDKIRFKIRG